MLLKIPKEESQVTTKEMAEALCILLPQLCSLSPVLCTEVAIWGFEQQLMF